MPAAESAACESWASWPSSVSTVVIRLLSQEMPHHTWKLRLLSWPITTAAEGPKRPVDALPSSYQHEKTTFTDQHKQFH